MFKHGSLFSGIGGFDLAAEWMGWENAFHCEWNDFGRKVLEYYWPNAKSYGDITKTDFTIWRGRIDILTGGFPCQPYSTAGKRKGKEDERHLWPEMLRAIREIKPTYIVGENVSGIVSWNGGLVFDEVQSDMENEGYEILTNLLPACGKNAPHKRERVWFVAYSASNRRERERSGIETKERLQPRPEPAGKLEGRFKGLCFHGATSDTINEGLQRTQFSKSHEERNGAKAFRPATEPLKIQSWDKWPTQSPVCNGNDGIPTQLDGITFPKWRNESIKAGGNAIVPQVAYEIFKAIQMAAIADNAGGKTFKTA